MSDTRRHAEPAQGPPEAPVIGGSPAAALAVLVACQALVLIDEITVNLTAARIAPDFGLSPGALSWVLNAYLLPFGGLLLLGGRAGDLLGRRRLLLCGLSLYTVACVARAVAPEPWLLFTSRAVQGVGAALMVPAVLALIVDLFPEGAPRRRAIGIYMAVSGAGTSVGLVMVGLLGSVATWRAVLGISAAIGIVLLVLAAVVVPQTGRNPGRLDVTGALTATAGITAVVFGLSNATTQWRDPIVIGSLLIGLILLALFVLSVQRGRSLLVAPGTLTRADRVPAYLTLALVQGTQVGQIFFLSQHLQIFLGYSPLSAALAFTPIAFGILATAPVVVRLLPLVGARRIVMAGSVVLMAANLYLLRLADDSSYWTVCLPALLLIGAGLAMCAIPATVITTAGVDDDQSGAAASLVNAVQTVGSSFALAVTVAVATTVGERAAERAPAGMTGQALEGRVFLDAMSSSFLTGVAFALATLAAAWTLPRHSRSSRDRVRQAASTP